MKKPSRAGGKPVKTRRRKAVTAKRRKEPKSARRRSSSAADQEAEVARLTRELNEARGQQTAVSEVLRVMSQSNFELQSTLHGVAQTAARLCRSDGAVIFQLESGVYHFAGGYSLSPAFLEIERQSVISPGPGTVIGRAAMTRQVARIDDALADQLYERKEDAKVEGNRSMIGVPLLRDGEPVVVIGLGRRRVDPFDKREIELATTFAAQAVIAIENARLLNELRSRTAELSQRTAELTEALEQQTATSEVLQVISSSPGDLDPVFSTVLEKAVRICEAKFGMLYRHENGRLCLMAARDVPPMFAAAQEGPFTPAPGGMLDSVMKTGRTVHLPDLAATQPYLERHPIMVEAVELGGVRTVVGVPLLKDNELVGAIGIFRQEVRPFTDKQIALVTNFATQAVIAIENTRLLSELRESLQEQTATSAVLQVISSSPGDLQPVFGAMLEKAVRICDAHFGNIYRWDGEALHVIATHHTPQAFVEGLRRAPYRPNPKAPIGQMVATKTVVHVTDVMANAAYIEQTDPMALAAVALGHTRTALAVPLLNEGEVIGAFVLSRQEVHPFNDRQIALITSFAAQAVIAIENARLLNELRQRTTDLTESLEQQTATSEVLQAINSSPGDLDPVFTAMLEKAVRICGAAFGNISRWDGEVMHLVAMHNAPAAFVEARMVSPDYRPGSKTIFGRLIATRTMVHIADLAADEVYVKERFPAAVSAVELGGVRTLLAVPMLKENKLIGAISVYRQEVRPFTDKQITLVTNFAAQAVIAIENARLLSELRESLQEQTATSEVLQVISSSPGDLQPVFAAMLEKAVRICDATFGNIYRWDGDALQLVATHNTPPAYAEHRKQSPFRAEHNNSVAQMITSKKVVHLLDAAANETYATRRDPTVVAAVELGGIRSALIVPMLKEDELVGAFIVSRQEVRPFTEKQIALVTNFAAQAVIAIENARLLMELRERTEEVENLNQQLEQRVTDQVGEIERMGRLRRFLPPQVADLIVASGTEKQLQSHRREITALFCDLRGFTGFTESADAEDVMALLRDYHAAIGEIIIKYSGTLERYAGDGVMVIFNDPVPVENPALQAVLMALEMRDAIGALTDRWRRLGHEIGFGIGIAHGYATLGTIGFEGRFDYAAIGTVSNVASRLCDEAKPGQILISPRVLMAVKDAVTVEAVGEFELKGIRRPTAAYNVLAASSQSP